MKFPGASAALMLASSALAASQKDPFAINHAKSLSSTPIKLDDAAFNDLTRQPRNFTSVVLLTALEARVGCQLCREFAPEWDLIAKNWIRNDKSGATRVVFGTLDFADGRQTFQAVLDIDHRICRLIGY